MNPLPEPGQFPYTRGIYPEMYRTRLWTMRQYAGFGTAEESNQRYRYLLSQGITGLSVAFDLPTQMGMDADHPLAAGEVGRVGVAISSLSDMERLFDGIRLDEVSTSMTINSTASTLLALYVLAARRLYAHLMRDRFGAKDPKSMMLRFHTQTAGATLTAQQPEVNVVRVAMQALAAVMGGTQSLHTNSLDEALGLPTQESASLALRTQQIIAYETGVTKTVDPLGGSIYVERLTDEVEAGARAYLDQIDAMGGTLAAIEKGFIQGEIQNAAYAYQRAIEKGERIVVGVNKFRLAEERPIPVFKIDPAMEAQQVARLREVRAGRSASEVAARLSALTAAARGTENLMPHIVAACDAQATVGEVSGALRAVFGEYRERL